MSLFPAYSDEPNTSTSTSNQEQTTDENSWLKNPSFKEVPQDLFQSSKSQDASEDEDKTEGDKDEEQQMLYESTEQHIKKKKKKKDKKKSSKRKYSDDDGDDNKEMLDFTGEEEYYVDKKPTRGYLTVKTLYWPACPKYRTRINPLGISVNHSGKYKIKRYFTKSKNKNNDSFDVGDDNDSELINFNDKTLSEEEYSTKSKEINRKLSMKLKDIDLWIEYVNLQDRTSIKSTKTQLAERKMEIIERALIHNHGNERLYRLYVKICNATFPSFEVSKILDVLLAKDPTNYVLWSSQIFATQGSMARCVVPDVLKLYEECMQKMYRKSQQDEIMLKLFIGCALFLRQSGLNEQFFALIKLALELNASVSSEKLTKSFEPSETDQQTLIDYEEVILKSGLPMNEIWLRIEKLRENFNVLPLPVTTKNSTDPQRIVFNEDVCFFIYPLAHKDNCFTLLIIILRLLKIPFTIPASLQKRFLFKTENLNEFDAIEEILAVYLYRSITSAFGKKTDTNFEQILYELVKETISGPSFLSPSIGYEIYLRTITEILFLCIEYFFNNSAGGNNGNERKRTVLMLIWLRFVRIQIIIDKLLEKLTQDKMKKFKTKIKNILKSDENRNVLNFYTEYALIEYEFGNLNLAENIFVQSITASIELMRTSSPTSSSSSSASSMNGNVQNSDLLYAYVTYVEVLMKEENYEKAMKILTCFALNIPLEELSKTTTEFNLTESKKLTAIKRLTDRLNNLLFIEKNVNIMELEQYFLPDYFINLLKAKTYYEILINDDKLNAIGYMENLLKRYFIEKNSRHTYLREMIYEFYLKILQMPNKKCFISNLLIYEAIQNAVIEYPENLYLLTICGKLDGQPWYKIRNLLMKANRPQSIIFLIASARYRCGKYLEYENEIMNQTYKIRIMNILKDVVDKNSSLRKNSIMWRLYLRSLCDIQATFELSKNKLFTALDECPWNKALYLDGSIVVPQELSQLQDLMIEKQLRMYALPEELEILRNDTFEIPEIVNDDQNKVVEKEEKT